MILLASRRREDLRPAIATGLAIKLRDSVHANKLLGGGAERAAGALGRGQTRPNAPFLRLK